MLPPPLFAALARQMRRHLGKRGVNFGAVTRPSERERPSGGPYCSRLNNALWGELRTAGLPEILHGEDALSMAFSLESRPPFLDHRVVEFCFSLAYDEKIAEGWTKLLLRRATSGILPEPIRLRRQKLGFPGDYAGWLGRGAGLDAVQGLLLDRTTLERGWLNRKSLQDNLGRSRRRAERWVNRNPQTTWRAVTFELWCRQFLDRDRSLVPALSNRTRTAKRALSHVAPSSAA